MTDTTLQSIENWFVRAVPNPTNANKSVQLGCHFEEVREMALEGLRGDEDSDVVKALKELSDDFKTAPCDPEGIQAVEDLIARVDRKELADALADQIVTAIGVAHMFGINIRGALDEVDRSNWSKFKDGQPIFDENGKIAKNPETYFKADMTAFV